MKAHKMDELHLAQCFRVTVPRHYIRRLRRHTCPTRWQARLQHLFNTQDYRKTLWLNANKIKRKNELYQ